jgi:hypothetical protein
VFFRIKQSGPRSYLQIVENQRDGGAVRQTVIATLGLTWSLDFGQVVKLGSPFGEDGPYGGQTEAVFS